MKSLIATTFAISSLTLALTGCSTVQKLFKSDDVKPNALPNVQVSQHLQNLYNASTKATPKTDPLRFQMVRSDNVYFIAGSDGEVSANQNGRKLWNVRPSKSLSSGITVADGVAVVGNPQGQLFGLDRKTGATLWQKQLGGSILAPSAIVQQRVISVANDGTVYAHDATSGQRLWTFDLPNVSFSVRGYAQPIVIDSRTVVVATANGYVYALDSITGVPLWQQRVAVESGRGDMARLIDIDGQPQVIDGKLITVSYQGQVTVMDIASQKVQWSQDASSLNSAAVDSNAVYVATTDGHVKAYALDDGHALWDNDQLLNRHLSNPARIGDDLVVGDYEGVLHLIDPTNGHLVGREKTRGAVRTLRVEDNQLWVSTTTGQYSVWQAR